MDHTALSGECTGQQALTAQPYKRLGSSGPLRPPLPLGIGRGPAGNPKYNDVEVQHDEAALRFLLDNGLDAALAAHVAHQLVRDPLVLYRETMDQGLPGRAWSGLVRERGRGGGVEVDASPESFQNPGALYGGRIAGTKAGGRRSRDRDGTTDDPPTERRRSDLPHPVMPPSARGVPASCAPQTTRRRRTITRISAPPTGTRPPPSNL